MSPVVRVVVIVAVLVLLNAKRGCAAEVNYSRRGSLSFACFVFGIVSVDKHVPSCGLHILQRKVKSCGLETRSTWSKRVRSSGICS